VYAAFFIAWQENRRGDDEEEEEECCICYLGLSAADLVTTPCRHVFHRCGLAS
jgi:hypothetical protein